MAPRKKLLVLPPIPAKAFGVLGAFPVREDPTLYDTCKEAAHVNFSDREVVLDAGFSPIGKWQNFGHEQMHIVLYDGAVNTGITEEQAELVCDAFGTWFAAAIKAGYIIVDASKA
jgi:hypothetical protein